MQIVEGWSEHGKAQKPNAVQEVPISISLNPRSLLELQALKLTYSLISVPRTELGSLHIFTKNTMYTLAVVSERDGVSERESVCV